MFRCRQLDYKDYGGEALAFSIGLEEKTQEF